MRNTTHRTADSIAWFFQLAMDAVQIAPEAPRPLGSPPEAARFFFWELRLARLTF